ncbi:MAG TPA: hypothetical protein VKU77_31480 [Streptosporangiaceae bacterium]|nr:hypothetical protein [Streptosporangiaceae bacterium]
MIVIAGLVILAAAAIAGLAGVLANSGHAHPVTHFAVLGYHVTGSTGTVFLSGTVVGALAMLGLSLLAAGSGRSSRRGRAAKASLAQSRRETAAVIQQRDDLISQRATARTYTVLDEQRNYTASTLCDGDGSLRASPDPGRPDPWPGGPRPAVRRPAGRPGTLPGQAADAPAAQTAAGAPAPGNDSRKAAS